RHGAGVSVRHAGRNSVWRIDRRGHLGRGCARTGGAPAGAGRGRAHARTDHQRGDRRGALGGDAGVRPVDLSVDGRARRRTGSGAAGTMVSLLINLTASVNNALVSQLAGAGGVAGYGTAARLEFLMIPLAFGLGGPLVAMVGTNMGAGHRERALRIVLIGGAVA